MPEARGDAAPFADLIEQRIALALIDVIAEEGYTEASVEAVVERAGVSREQFEARFAGKEECALRVLEAYIGEFREQVRAAYESHEGWRDGLRAAGYAAADWIVANPRKARFGAVDVLEAQGEMMRIRREEIFQYCAGLIAEGRREAADPEAISEATPVMAIGSIAQMLTDQYQRGVEVQPVRMVPQLMYLAVKPYVGEELAREELTMPRPER